MLDEESSEHIDIILYPSQLHELKSDILNTEKG